MRYYSLTVKTGNGMLQPGSRIFNAEAPLTIGQLESSDIHLPCDEDMLPQCFCTIVKDTNGNGWLLIKKSDFYAVSVNSQDIDYICRLNPKDVISVEGNAFVFNVFDDDKYIEEQGVVLINPNRKIWQVLLLLSALILIIAGILGYQMYSQTMSHFTSSDNTDIRSSVYKIIVSEILLQQHTPADKDGEYYTIDSFEPDSLSTGTCFFSKDSLCITARHCVEPWLDYSGWADNIKMEDLPKAVSWAVLSEKNQIEQADTLYRIVSHCQVIDEDSCIYEFTTDTVSFNRSRDIVAHMGDEQLPWRFIYPLFSKKDVELGDFAFVKTDRRGKLDLATEDYLIRMDCDEDSGKRIYGFPKTNHGNQWEYQEISHISIPEKQDNRFTQCLQLNVNGTSGYSGAPVIEKKNGKLMVIGIFSKIDDFVDSKNTFYAVPANEVSQYNQIMSDEKKQYRR